MDESQRAGVSDLPNGTSIRVHADLAMGRVEEVVQSAFAYIRANRKIRPADRARLSRELAGAIGSLESLRLWLNKGAPQ